MPNTSDQRHLPRKDRPDAAVQTLLRLGYRFTAKGWTPPGLPESNGQAPRTLVAMVLIETTDERVFPENADLTTPATVEVVRTALIANLPNIRRVVAVMDEGTARMMCAGHAFAARAAGLDMTLRMSPEDYRPPGDTVKPDFPGA
jgi:hypothetical protein